MNKWKFWKRRYMIIVKRKKESEKKNKVFYYNLDRTEIMLDAYWAFIFMDAEKVTIRSTKHRKKILRTFNNVEEWKNEWTNMFGPNARYFVWKNRH